MNSERTKRYFYSLMEWMEKYIEKTGYFSDWEQRKQVENNSVVREDMNGPEKEDKLSVFA